MQLLYFALELHGMCCSCHLCSIPCNRKIAARPEAINGERVYVAC